MTRCVKRRFQPSTSTARPGSGNHRWPRRPWCISAFRVGHRNQDPANELRNWNAEKQKCDGMCFVVCFSAGYYFSRFATTRDETVFTCTEGPVWVWLHVVLHVSICCFSILRQGLLMWRETRSARGITIQSKQLYTRSDKEACFNMSPCCISNCVRKCWYECFNAGSSCCWIFNSVSG